MRLNSRMILCVSWPLSSQTPIPYREFWRLWQEEKYFECHEVLEDLWRDTTGCEKLFYNGLIHCAVAIYQHQRGNHYGAARQLCRATVKLEPFRPRYQQVDIECLLEAVVDEISVSLGALNEIQKNALSALREALEADVRNRIDCNFPQEFKG